MFNPILALHEPVQDYPELDEEQFAQRHGRTVRNFHHRSQLALRLGRLFFRIGERLTREDPCMEHSRQDPHLGFSKESV